MNQAATLALFGILSVLPSFAQANQTDSQTLQAILTEVRAIHNEARLGQTTQLLLAELQIQQTAVDRAIQRRDDLRSKLSQTQANQKELVERLARFQGVDVEATTDPEKKKDDVAYRDSVKSELEIVNSQARDVSNDLQEAENSLGREQSTLDNIQAQLSDVVKKLQPASGR